MKIQRGDASRVLSLQVHPCTCIQAFDTSCIALKLHRLRRLFEGNHGENCDI